MKKTFVYCALLGGVLALGGCASKGSTGTVNAAADAAAAGVEHTAWTVQYDDCNLPFGTWCLPARSMAPPGACR